MRGCNFSLYSIKAFGDIFHSKPKKVSRSKRNAVNSACLLLVIQVLLPAYLRGATAVAAWVQRYNGPGNFSDSAEAIAVDETGNVYVAGTSAGMDNDSGCVTVAYSPGGTPVWTNRFDGGVD